MTSKWLLYFCKFSQTPTSTSNLTASSENQWNWDSKDVLCVRKYCQLFTHESNTFVAKMRHWNQWGGFGAINPRNRPFPFGHIKPHTQMPKPAPLTTPNNSSIGSRIFAQLYATNFPLVLMGRPKFTPKTAPSHGRSPTPSDTPIPRPTPLTTRTAIEMLHDIALYKLTIDIDFGIRIHSDFLPIHTQGGPINEKYVWLPTLKSRSIQ